MQDFYSWMSKIASGNGLQATRTHHGLQESGENQEPTTLLVKRENDSIQVRHCSRRRSWEYGGRCLLAESQP